MASSGVRQAAGLVFFKKPALLQFVADSIDLNLRNEFAVETGRLRYPSASRSRALRNASVTASASLRLPALLIAPSNPQSPGWMTIGKNCAAVFGVRTGFVAEALIISCLIRVRDRPQRN